MRGRPRAAAENRTSAAASPAPPAAAAPGAAAAVPEAQPLPPIESLTIDSDFAVFLQPTVEETLKRKALKKLFADPRFNVMDGLDVYIDDYSKPDPLDPNLARKLAQLVFDAEPAPDDPPRVAAVEHPGGASAVQPPEAAAAHAPPASPEQHGGDPAADPGSAATDGHHRPATPAGGSR